MFQFLGKAFNRALEGAGLSREEFAYKVLPLFLLDIIQRYLRVEVEGAEHLPKKGGYITVANHSGYMGFDALMVAHQVFSHTKRIPRIITHKLWFLMPEISVHAHKMGLIPATYENGLSILNKKQPLILFPEGEEGNFKPTRLRYRLRRFRRGFVRLAYATGVPIVPCTIIGAEETHITLSQIRWAKEVLGILIPIPLNVVPLPARWSIRFHKPIVFGKHPEKLEDSEHITDLAHKMRLQLQRAIHGELKERKTIFA